MVHTVTSWPFRRSPMAAVNPPIPAPTIEILRGFGPAPFTCPLISLTPLLEEVAAIPADDELKDIVVQEE